MNTSEVEPVIQVAKHNMFLLILKKKQFPLFYLYFFGLVVPFITSKNGQTQPSAFPPFFLQITIIMPIKVVKHDRQKKQTVA